MAQANKEQARTTVNLQVQIHSICIIAFTKILKPTINLSNGVA